MTLAEFYADERRRTSTEVSFGLEWTLDTDPHATYGVHWIERTREIYTLRGPQPPVEAGVNLVDTSPLRQVAREAFAVDVLGELDDVSVLDGWEDHMARRNSLEWVRGRLGS